MSTEDVYLEAADRMEKTVEALEHQLRTIRTGRASPALVDHLRIDYYGAQTPLGQIANIAAPEPQMLVIRPFDPSAVKTIEKAIQASDIGITPNSDGKLIRLAIPPLSEERRRQLAAQVKQMSEQAKVSIRNIRRDANRDIDKQQSDSVISEDEAYKGKDEVQELTKESETKADAILNRKTEEIMKF
jgi:ribosome recycling factor